MKYLKNYEKLEFFEIFQIVKLLYRIYIDLREDQKVLIILGTPKNSLIIKRHKLLLECIIKELKYIKTLYGDKEEYKDLYSYLL